MIEKYRKSLIAKAKKEGLTENFGEKEGRQLEDALTDLERADTNYDDRLTGRNAVRSFHQWAMNYTLT